MSCSDVRANCAGIIFFATSSCRMLWSMCWSKACASTPDGRGHSWPLSAVGKVYREFVLDHGTCHAFLYACTQIFCRPSNSLCDNSMRAAENRKAPIPFWMKNSAESSGVSGWLWLGHAPLSLFTYYLSCGAHVTIPRAPVTLVLARVIDVYCFDTFVIYPQIWCWSAFPSLSIVVNYEQEIFFTLISMPHHVVNSCTTSSKVCIPSGVSAKIEILSMNPMLLNW